MAARLDLGPGRAPPHQRADPGVDGARRGDAPPVHRHHRRRQRLLAPHRRRHGHRAGLRRVQGPGPLRRPRRSPRRAGPTTSRCRSRAPSSRPTGVLGRRLRAGRRGARAPTGSLGHGPIFDLGHATTTSRSPSPRGAVGRPLDNPDASAAPPCHGPLGRSYGRRPGGRGRGRGPVRDRHRHGTCRAVHQQDRAPTWPAIGRLLLRRAGRLTSGDDHRVDTVGADADGVDGRRRSTEPVAFDRTVPTTGHDPPGVRPRRHHAGLRERHARSARASIPSPPVGDVQGLRRLGAVPRTTSSAPCRPASAHAAGRWRGRARDHLQGSARSGCARPASTAADVWVRTEGADATGAWPPPSPATPACCAWPGGRARRRATSSSRSSSSRSPSPGWRAPSSSTGRWWRATSPASPAASSCPPPGAPRTRSWPGRCSPTPTAPPARPCSPRRWCSTPTC